MQSLASLPGQLAEGQNFGKGCWRRQHCQLGLQPGPRLSRLLGDKGIHFTGFKCFSRLVGDRVIHYIGSKLGLSTIPLAFVFSELLASASADSPLVVPFFWKDPLNSSSRR